jgi:hypothetical protein
VIAVLYLSEENSSNTVAREGCDNFVDKKRADPLHRCDVQFAAVMRSTKMAEISSESLSHSFSAFRIGHGLAKGYRWIPKVALSNAPIVAVKPIPTACAANGAALL